MFNCLIEISTIRFGERMEFPWNWKSFKLKVVKLKLHRQFEKDAEDFFVLRFLVFNSFLIQPRGEIRGNEEQERRLDFREISLAFEKFQWSSS